MNAHVPPGPPLQPVTPAQPLPAATAPPIKPPGPLPVQGYVFLAVGLGWAVIFLRSWLGGLGWLADFASLNDESAVAAAATWLLLVLLFVAAWDLAAARWDWVRPLDPFGRWRVPSWLRPWLPPAFLVLGLLFGHWLWP